jgi:hypothetical protein
MAAYLTITSLARSLPLPVLSNHASFIYLGLAPRLANEPEAEAVSVLREALLCLFGRLTNDRFVMLLDYTFAWLQLKNCEIDEGLIRVGTNAIRLMTEARPDIMSKDFRTTKAFDFANSALHELFPSDAGIMRQNIKWQIIYNIFIMIEGFLLFMASSTCHLIIKTDANYDVGSHRLVAFILQGLRYSHDGLYGIACHLIFLFINKAESDTKELLMEETEIVNSLCRNLFSIFNRPSLHQTVLEQAAFCLVFVLRHAIKEGQGESSAEIICDDIDKNNNLQSPLDLDTLVSWVGNRLQSLSNDLRGNRRFHVLKVSCSLN